MLRVPVKQARAGMVLALPVHHPCRYASVLLQAGLQLDDTIVHRLGELGLREVWIRYPGTEVLSKYISPQLFEARAKLAGRVGDAFKDAGQKCNARLDFGPYRAAVSSLLETILADGRTTVFMEEILAHGEPTLRHASNVCFLSLLVGLVLGDYLIAERSRLSPGEARDVTALGLGAMLHDIGMLRLSDETLDRWAKSGGTGDEDDAHWQQHVVVGHQLVRETVGPAASAVVMHHHQKYDGTGFPQRERADGAKVPVAGRDIHVFARIVAACDVFDRLRFGPDAPGERGNEVPLMSTARALRLMQSPPYSQWVDPVVLEALLDVVPPFAPGSLVRLSNGLTCFVRECDPDYPCRPVVQAVDLGGDDHELRLTSAPRQRLRWSDPIAFDLRTMPEVRVEFAEGFDVSADLFERRSRVGGGRDAFSFEDALARRRSMQFDLPP